MPKISVIVPIHNADQYLDQCVQSILNQSFDNLEIILVDAASTDGSLAIMNKYAEQDDRVRTVSIDNPHLGPAKNLGISMATGDLIDFVGATDFLGTDNIKNMADSMEKYQSDIAFSTYYRVDPNGTYYFFTNDNDPAQQDLVGVFSPEDFVKREVNGPVNIQWSFIGSYCKLIKRGLFENVLFPDLPSNDNDFTMWKLYLLADRISYINVGDYCLRELPSQNLSTQQLHQQAWYRLKSLEERLALYAMIEFDTTFLNDKYYNALVDARDTALNAGNYHNYKDCCFKIETIDRYTAEDQDNPES